MENIENVICRYSIRDLFKICFIKEILRGAERCKATWYSFHSHKLM